MPGTCLTLLRGRLRRHLSFVEGTGLGEPVLALAGCPGPEGTVLPAPTSPEVTQMQG